MSSTEVTSVLIAAVSFISAVASILYAMRNDRSSIKNDIIATYETRLTQLDTDVKALRVQLTEMSEKFDRSESDRKNAEDRLNLRNPEFERYMAQSLKMLTDIHAAVLPQTVTPV